MDVLEPDNEGSEAGAMPSDDEGEPGEAGDGDVSKGRTVKKLARDTDDDDNLPEATAEAILGSRESSYPSTQAELDFKDDDDDDDDDDDCIGRLSPLPSSAKPKKTATHPQKSVKSASTPLDDDDNDDSDSRLSPPPAKSKKNPPKPAKSTPASKGKGKTGKTLQDRLSDVVAKEAETTQKMIELKTTRLKETMATQKVEIEAQARVQMNRDNLTAKNERIHLEQQHTYRMAKLNAYPQPSRHQVPGQWGQGYGWGPWGQPAAGPGGMFDDVMYGANPATGSHGQVGGSHGPGTPLAGSGSQGASMYGGNSDSFGGSHGPGTPLAGSAQSGSQGTSMYAGNLDSIGGSHGLGPGTPLAGSAQTGSLASNSMSGPTTRRMMDELHSDI